MQHSQWGSHEQNHLPGWVWLSGLGVHTADSCPAFHLQKPPSPALQAALKEFFSLSVLMSGIAPNLRCSILHLDLLNLVRFSWVHVISLIFLFVYFSYNNIFIMWEINPFNNAALHSGIFWLSGELRSHGFVRWRMRKCKVQWQTWHKCRN